VETEGEVNGAASTDAGRAGIRRRRRPEAGAVRALAVSAAAIVVVIAVTTPRGQESRGGPMAAGARAAAAGTDAARGTATGPRRDSHATTTPARGGAAPAPTTSVPLVRRPRLIAVVGDGIATTFAPGLEAVAATHGTDVVVNAFPGCGIANGVAVDDDGTPFPWAALCAEAVGPAQQRMIDKHDPDVVVWLSTWDLSDRLAPGGRVLHTGTPAHDAALDADLDTAARRLTSGGARLVLVVPAPRWGLDVDAADRDAPTAVAHHERLLRRFVVTHPSVGAVVVDASDVLCAAGPPCPEWVAGIRPRPDGGHFSPGGATWTAERLLPEMLAALGAR
jgi:hypothetical protein